MKKYSLIWQTFFTAILVWLIMYDNAYALKLFVSLAAIRFLAEDWLK